MKVLEGIRVVDLSQNIAGPHCTQLLADLGADVVKIEPPAGDPARRWGPPFWGEDSPLFLSFNRNKRSVALDLKKDEAREALWRLVDTADVFVQAYRKGVADRLGFGYPEVAARRPGIVYVSVTGFGSKGPLAEAPGYDPLIQAYTGVMSVTGYPDGPPARIGGSMVDVGTGVVTSMGVLAALRQRDQTGKSVHVESSLLATSLGAVAYHVQGYMATGHVPGRMGTGLAMIAPYEAFATTDGELMIAAGNQGIFERLCAALGLDDLVADSRFGTNPDRVAHRTELRPLVEAATRVLSTAQLIAVLAEHRVPCAPIQDIAQVAADEQIRANGMIQSVEHPTIPDYEDVAFPVTFDGERPGAERPPPAIGQHSEEVLAEIGFSAKEILALSG